ncbi:hypothetical protein RRG08_064349 [Elysia crispata]|uniref:Uncharacterized protein n=1 Tax=Elysia crispata TaxID=231223 RepID=A0AAE0ZLP6_9GAST|nr:hypothetical protein RRG08_064349 [Elysia crispata]
MTTRVVHYKRCVESDAGLILSCFHHPPQKPPSINLQHGATSKIMAEPTERTSVAAAHFKQVLNALWTSSGYRPDYRYWVLENSEIDLGNCILEPLRPVIGSCGHRKALLQCRVIQG